MVRVTPGEWSIMKFGAWLPAMVIAMLMLGFVSLMQGYEFTCDSDCEIAQMAGGDPYVNEALAATLIISSYGLFLLAFVAAPYALASLRDRARRVRHFVADAEYTAITRRKDLLRDTPIMWGLWFIATGLVAAIIGAAAGGAAIGAGSLGDEGLLYALPGLAAMSLGTVIMAPWKRLRLVDVQAQ